MLPELWRELRELERHSWILQAAGWVANPYLKLARVIAEKKTASDARSAEARRGAAQQYDDYASRSIFPTAPSYGITSASASMYMTAATAADKVTSSEKTLARAIRERAQAEKEALEARIDAWQYSARNAASYASAEDALFWGHGDAETMLQEAVLDPLDRVLAQSREAMDKFWPTVTESTEETMARIGDMLRVPELEQLTEIELPEAGKQWSLFGDSVDNTADAMQMAAQTARMMGDGLSELGLLSDSAARTVQKLVESVSSIVAAAASGSVDRKSVV